MSRVQPKAAPAAAPKTTVEATNPAAPQVANPGEVAPVEGTPATPAKAKRSRGDLVVHPALKPDDKGHATVKLEKFPEDYKTTKHKLITSANFVSEKAYLIAKAERLEAEAAELRKQAESTATFGPNAAAFAKQLKRFEEIKAKMETEGVDVNALIATLRAKAEKTEEKKS